MAKPTHKVLVPENYTTADGEEKTFFTRVGSAWKSEGEKGTVSIKIRDGIAVSGKLVIMPVTETIEEPAE